MGNLDFDAVRKDWADEDNKLIGMLHDASTPKTKLGQQYLLAGSIADLLYIASEPRCLSTAEIFFCLNSPGEINLAADIRKQLEPEQYWIEWGRTRRVNLLSRGFCSLKSGWWVTVVGRMLAEIKTGSVVTGVWPRGYGNSPGPGQSNPLWSIEWGGSDGTPHAASR
jgi:hypothetical protein